MGKERNALLHGTVEALILKTLAHGPRHGYAIARWIEDVTGGRLLIEEGTLYPALYRMEGRGVLRSEWGRSELDRRAKFYHLTPSGEAQLREEVEAWTRFSTAVTMVMTA